MNTYSGFTPVVGNAGATGVVVVGSTMIFCSFSGIPVLVSDGSVWLSFITGVVVSRVMSVAGFLTRKKTMTAAAITPRMIRIVLVFIRK